MEVIEDSSAKSHQHHFHFLKDFDSLAKSHLKIPLLIGLLLGDPFKVSESVLAAVFLPFELKRALHWTIVADSRSPVPRVGNLQRVVLDCHL